MENIHGDISNLWLLNGIINGLYEPCWQMRQFLKDPPKGEVSVSDQGKLAFICSEYEEAARRLTQSKRLIAELLVKIEQLTADLPQLGSKERTEDGK